MTFAPQFARHLMPSAPDPGLAWALMGVIGGEDALCPAGSRGIVTWEVTSEVISHADSCFLAVMGLGNGFPN